MIGNKAECKKTFNDNHFIILKFKVEFEKGAVNFENVKNLRNLSNSTVC